MYENGVRTYYKAYSGTAKKFYDMDEGLDKSTGYIQVGGSRWENKYIGYIKNLKLYYDSVLTTNQITCLATDEFCKNCATDGKCTECHENYKLVSGKC